MAIRRTALLLLAGLAASLASASERSAGIAPAQVANVTLILIAPGVQFRAPPTRATLEAVGCSFSASFQADKSAEMLAILKRNIVEIPAGEAHHFYLRNAVYLRMTDGTTLRYLFSASDHPGNAVYGGSETGATASYIPFMSDERLLRELRRWAASGTAQKNPQSWCVDKAKFLQEPGTQP